MRVLYLGKRPFKVALQLQEAIFSEKIARQKALARLLKEHATSVSQPSNAVTPHQSLLPDTVLVLEHADHVFTVGRRDTTEGLPTSRGESATVTPGHEVVKLRRGGGLTYHGPGQVTVYPIANIQSLWKASPSPIKGPSPIRWYSDQLEHALVETCRHFGLPSHGGCTGAWIPSTTRAAAAAAENEGGMASSSPTPIRSKATCATAHSRKAGSIGLQLSDWVSMHGVSLNVCCDLSYFDSIVMCEMPDRRATSLHQELTARGTATGQKEEVMPSVDDCGRLLARTIIRLLHHSTDTEKSPLEEKEVEGERNVFFGAEETQVRVADSELVAYCLRTLDQAR